MAELYRYGRNLIQDLLFNIIIITEDKFEKQIDKITNSIDSFIYEIVNDDHDFKFLDYEIEIYNHYYIKIISNNIITALWFSGIKPDNCNDVYRENSLKLDDKIYSFNKKKKKLIVKQILN